MIRSVVFDMGNVLIHFKPDRFIRRAGVTDRDIREMLLREVFGAVEWALMDWGALDEGEFERRVLPRIPAGHRDTARGLIHGWNRPPMPVKGMEQLVKKCKAVGLGVFLLSNASKRLHDYWHEIPASGLFDGLVVSADLGCVKPMPEIYRHLLKTHRLAAEECLFVDDMAINVAGALQAGMQGFLFRENPDELARQLFGRVL